MGSPKRIEWILNEIHEEDKVLDIGRIQHKADKEAGQNWLHSKLKAKASYVLGADRVKEEVDFLRSKRYNICYGDAEKLDLAETFDAAVAGELIEHLSNPGLFPDGVRRHLKRAGRLIITTPNPFFFYRVCQALLGNVICNVDHTCYYDKRTISQFPQRHGFKATSVSYSPPPKGGKGVGRNIGYAISFALYYLGFRAVGGQGMLVIGTRGGE